MRVLPPATTEAKSLLLSHNKHLPLSRRDTHSIINAHLFDPVIQIILQKKLMKTARFFTTPRQLSLIVLKMMPHFSRSPGFISFCCTEYRNCKGQEAFGGENSKKIDAKIYNQLYFGNPILFTSHFFLN